MRELVYCVSVSLDGFIARPDGGFDDLLPSPGGLAAIAARLPETLPGFVRERLAPERPNQRFDTVVMGRRTYDIGLMAGIEDPYPALTSHVVTSRPGEIPAGGPTVLEGEPVAALRRIKASPGAGIWLCGGGTLAAALEEEIDELLLKRVPVLLGDGVPLFAGTVDPRRWRRTAAEDVDGLEITSYRRD